MKRRCFLKVCAVSMAAAPVVARSQDRIIRIVVPFAPGGSGDLIPRIVAPAMSERLGMTVIVENRAGAGGVIGATYVARAPADGLTLGVATVSTHAIQPAVLAKPPYDPLKDFAPISNLARVPNVISINPGLPAQDMAEFIKLAKQRGGDITYGSPGVGSLGHMMGELFAQATGAAMRHIPYRGAGPALQDAIAGHVDVLCDNLPASLPHIQGKRLRALAVAWPGRVEQLPDVPTFAQVGVQALNDPAWFGLVAPAGTPAEFVQRVSEAAAVALKHPEVAGRIRQLGAVPQGGQPEAYVADIQSELDKWRRVASAGNISLEAN
ncbi:Bug family tripartite tricarboxylate transporter substrate binding protein [Achromobacter anxifer]